MPEDRDIILHMSIRRPSLKFYSRVACLIVVLGISNACGVPDKMINRALSINNASQAVSAYSFRIVNTFPHDTGAFTQGLVLENGSLYEGTGLYGESSIRKVDLATGKVTQIFNLPAQYYGEGITIINNKIMQLTLESNKGFVYDKKSFNLLREFSYPNQGWGLTYDGNHLIMSDGTSTLYLLDPDNFKMTGQIEVRDQDVPLRMINELEYIEGKIYANIWKTDNVVIIDPASGRVTGRINLSGLLNKSDYGQFTDVLNGIAYDANSGHMFVTGKLWPKLFEIELVPR